jgi:hypothetical protein
MFKAIEEFMETDAPPTLPINTHATGFRKKRYRVGFEVGRCESQASWL